MAIIRTSGSLDKPTVGFSWIWLIVVLVFIALLTYFLSGKFPKTEKAMEIENPAPEYNISHQNKISNAKGNYNFDDGLGTPDSSTKYELNDFGEGIASSEVFNMDINKDYKKDKITRSRYENGTDHFYYSYKIELNTGNGFSDITPSNFKTTEGAECSLKKFRFVFKPEFQVIEISRNWEQSWVNPTPATRKIYKLAKNELVQSSLTKLQTVCNVSDLFN
ncbi:MAG TPA: hypothetical protein PKJ33_04055 [Alphaproteobacteria bacterium]|nr:hypothetical protein [Alphaproteobacteria bacterium]